MKHLPILTLALLAAGCAQAPVGSADAQDCREFLESLDRRIEAQGLRDAGAHRVPGYPYLRADRFLASFADDVGDGTRWFAWVEALRQRDLAARRAELQNLDEETQLEFAERADQCGRRRAAAELRDPEARARLKSAVAVPDAYNPAARAVGLFPLALPALAKGIRDYEADVRADYALRLDQLQGPGLSVWTPLPIVPGVPAGAAKAPFARDALGVPQPDATQWATLLQRHAPTWWIEQSGEFDRPAELKLDAAGKVVADPSSPVAYYLTGHTRFGSQILPYLAYMVWFTERPETGRNDSAAGHLDGVIWRVVLDPQGQVLAYDTIHPCGCYRYTYPVQALTPRAQPKDEEALLLPQANVPKGPVALRIQTATHYVRRVVDERIAHGRARTYRLLPYETLLSLPLPNGARRSAFGPDGLIDGTDRRERWWLWLSGVPEPGAMRQWGRHATAFIGEHQFDDARYLEQMFELPAWAR